MTDKSGYTSPVWLEVFHRTPTWEYVEVAACTVLARCGEAFDEGCGDCLVCFHDCPYGQGRWVLYTDDDEEVGRIFGPLFDAINPTHNASSVNDSTPPTHDGRGA